ncbi:MAG TPA: hypothetical protein VM307_08590 [Egibacteraceae bacterium]|nr:hypothetical protein [Egibacteraceae bacterium]
MKLRFLTGLALGYVFGTRAGREQYDKLLQSLRDLGESDLARQAKDEIGKLTGGGSSSSDQGLVTPPVVVGPGPQGTTQAGGPVDIAVPDLEPSTSTAEPTGTAKRLDPPAGKD